MPKAPVPMEEEGTITKVSRRLLNRVVVRLPANRDDELSKADTQIGECWQGFVGFEEMYFVISETKMEMRPRGERRKHPRPEAL